MKDIKDFASSQKLRGGYYTPEPIAQFLIDWALDSNITNISILEPSMGDGAFIRPLADSMLKLGYTKEDVYKSITGVELFSEEVGKAIASLSDLNISEDNLQFFIGDFFDIVDTKIKTKKFDVILGNPPFIRYQNFPVQQRDRAMKQLLELGFKQNKLTNAWLLFLLRSIMLLKENGRLAMVIPAELLQVNYAAATRKFLSEHFSSVTIITFRTLIFEGIQQEVVLLLAEKRKDVPPAGIDLIEINDVKELSKYVHIIKSPEHLKPIDHLSDKWTQYFLDRSDIELLKSLESNRKLIKLGKLASVDVGIVTGNNKFFVVNESTLTKYDIRSYTKPLVGRSAYLMGINFDERDWGDIAKKDLPSYLLAINKEDEMSSELQEYIKFGEVAGANLGYKCRIRKSWYVVPSVSSSEAFLLRQVHAYPKIIVNEADAVCTDTLHRVKMINSTGAKELASCFVNSLSFAISEVVGRSYGGGILELEPSEAESILVPYDLEVAKTIDYDYINACIRDGKVDEVLDYNDKKLLIDYLGFSSEEARSFRNIWRRLSDRRINRR